MVDLETLSTSPDGLLLSIGAVRFDIDRAEVEASPVENGFERGISIADGMSRCRKIDSDTLMWWLNQSGNALADLNRLQKLADCLPVVLESFSTWAEEDPTVKYLWGHGASFDPVLLSSSYNCCGLKMPFKYTNFLDTRTVFRIAGMNYYLFNKIGRAHV